MRKLITAAGLALLLTACTEAPVTTAAPDRYAGLDVAIRDWRTQILATDRDCVDKPHDQRCVTFTVDCKAERKLTPEDAAQGISERVVAAMSWDAWDTATSEYRAAVGFAEFRKTSAGWTRGEAARVNLESCATV